MKKNNLKAWLYLLPAFIFLGFFTIYPLVDIFVYSFEENFQFTREATGIGFGNYGFVLNDEKFLSAVRNTVPEVCVKVPAAKFTSFANVASLLQIISFELLFSITVSTNIPFERISFPSFISL